MNLINLIIFICLTTLVNCYPHEIQPIAYTSEIKHVEPQIYHYPNGEIIEIIDDPDFVYGGTLEADDSSLGDFASNLGVENYAGGDVSGIADHSVEVHEHKHEHKHDHDHHKHPKYKFEYGVKDGHTGDIKHQWEIRDGDKVKGGYTLNDSDGTKRVVEYTSDKHKGFHATVKRIGHAIHPNKHGHGYAESYANVQHHD